MGGHSVRVELYEVPRSLPAIRGTRQQILYLEGMLWIERQMGEVQLNPAGMDVIWTQVDHD